MVRFLRKTLLDQEPAIRVNTTVCMGRIAKNFDFAKLKEVRFECHDRMVSIHLLLFAAVCVPFLLACNKGLRAPSAHGCCACDRTHV